MSKNLFQAEREAALEDAILDAEFSEHQYYAQAERLLVGEYEVRMAEENCITNHKTKENENKQNRRSN